MAKGLDTKERILDTAFRLAGRDGLAGLTLNTLATELHMSKSGLFAHFRSKEELQLQVLDTAMARFTETVVLPALKAKRGLPRLKKLLDSWMLWVTDPTLPGGCMFIAAATELDDKEGKPREVLAASQREMRATIARIAASCIEAGDFRKDVDCEQFAFEVFAIILGYNHDKRLLRDEAPGERARRAFARLISDASA